MNHQSQLFIGLGLESQGEKDANSQYPGRGEERGDGAASWPHEGPALWASALLPGQHRNSTGSHTGATQMLVFPLQRPFADYTLSPPHQGWTDGGLVAKLVQLFAASWTVAHQAPLSMEFLRQEHWRGLPVPSPGDLPDPGIEPGSPALQADSLPSEPPGSQAWAEPSFLRLRSSLAMAGATSPSVT